MRRMLLLSGMAVLACVPCRGGDADTKDEVLQVVRKYEQSINRPDPALWLSIWDLEYGDLTILENDKPQMLGRKYVEQIAEWMKNAAPAKRQSWHTNRVILLRPDLAYVISLRTEHTMPEKQKESRISLLVRRTERGWKIIHSHFAFVPQ